MLDLQVRTSGPVFDGRSHAAVDDFLDVAERAVAQAGVDDVRHELRQVLRNPTGFYASQITTERVQDDMAVTDSGVVYGPWLAGVSSRNQTTGFRGYDHWRRATQTLDAKAGQIAERELVPFLRRMNG